MRHSNERFAAANNKSSSKMKAQIIRLYSDLFMHFAIVNYINKMELTQPQHKAAVFILVENYR